jgi:hypothetical protein
VLVALAMIRTTFGGIRFLATIVTALAFAAVMSACGEAESGDESPAAGVSEPALVECDFPDDREPPEPSNHIQVANTSCDTAEELFAHCCSSLGELKPVRPVDHNGKLLVPGNWTCQGQWNPDAFHVSCRDGEKRVEYDIY